MRKIILFTSTVAMLGLGLGGANALEGYSGYNAADNFAPSSQNDRPEPRSKQQFGGPDAETITSSTSVDRVTAGYPARSQFDGTNRVYRGYNASDDFAPSSQDDLPVR